MLLLRHVRVLAAYFSLIFPSPAELMLPQLELMLHTHRVARARAWGGHYYLLCVRGVVVFVVSHISSFPTI